VLACGADGVPENLDGGTPIRGWRGVCAFVSGSVPLRLGLRSYAQLFATLFATMGMAHALALYPCGLAGVADPLPVEQGFAGASHA
jgi:hypothetical protein